MSTVSQLRLFSLSRTPARLAIGNLQFSLFSSIANEDDKEGLNRIEALGGVAEPWKRPPEHEEYARRRFVSAGRSDLLRLHAEAIDEELTTAVFQDEQNKQQ